MDLEIYETEIAAYLLQEAPFYEESLTSIYGYPMSRFSDKLSMKRSDGKKKRVTFLSNYVQQNEPQTPSSPLSDSYSEGQQHLELSDLAAVGDNESSSVLEHHTHTNDSLYHLFHKKSPEDEIANIRQSLNHVEELISGTIGKINLLTEQNTNLEAENENLKKKNADQVSTNFALAEQNRLLENDRDQSVKSIASLKQTIIGLEDELRQRQHEIDESAQMNAVLKATNDTYEKKNADQVSINFALAQQNRLLENDRDQSVESIASLKQTISGLEDLLRQRQHGIDLQDTALGAVKRTIDRKPIETSIATALLIQHSEGNQAVKRHSESENYQSPRKIGRRTRKQCLKYSP